jgi:hypothetical protein
MTAAVTVTSTPTDPAKLADMLLDPTVSDADLYDRLTAQEGARPANRLLAEAHGIAADRLDALADA